MENNYNTKISNNLDNCEIYSELWYKYYFDGGHCSIFTGKCNVGGRLIFLPSENLRVTYSYYTQDHLGNNCAVVNEDGTLEQITHYYPFGDVYGDASLNVSSQTYKYNGKELDRMYILDRYDYGARSYDAVVPINTNKTSTNIKYTIDKKGKHGVWVAWKNGKAQFFYYDSMKPGTTNFNYDNNKKYNYEKNK